MVRRGKEVSLTSVVRDREGSVFYASFIILGLAEAFFRSFLLSSGICFILFRYNVLMS